MVRTVAIDKRNLTLSVEVTIELAELLAAYDDHILSVFANLIRDAKCAKVDRAIKSNLEKSVSASSTVIYRREV